MAKLTRMKRVVLSVFLIVGFLTPYGGGVASATEPQAAVAAPANSQRAVVEPADVGPTCVELGAACEETSGPQTRVIRRDRLAPLSVTPQALVAHPASVRAPAISRISVFSDGTESPVHSYLGSSTVFSSDESAGRAVSSDGRYVAFVSLAPLVPQEDNNTHEDIYVYDTQSGEVRLVPGLNTEAPSYNPSISADGRFVAFVSFATNLAEDDADPNPDVFLYDLQNDTTMIVSFWPDTGQIDSLSPSGEPSISEDGRYVAFMSMAPDVIPGDPVSVPQVYVRDVVSRTTTRVSVDASGLPANGASYHPAISSDGRYVAFTSEASNLGGDTNNVADIFVHDVTTRVTTRVSVASDGSEGTGASSLPSISTDGRYVAFQSEAPDLVDDDTNGAIDVFVHDRQAGQTVRVSVASDGVEANSYSHQASLSGDGRYVAFASSASNLGAEEVFSQHIYVHDRVEGITARISNAPDGAAGNNASYTPAISADGQYVAFASGASNLVPYDTNEVNDVFLYNGKAAELGIVPLTLGQPLTDSIDANERRYYSVTVEMPDMGLLVQVTPQTGIEALDVTGRLGQVPVLGRYDQRSQHPDDEGVYQFFFDPALVGTYYLRVLGMTIPASPGSYVIEARMVDHYVADVQPDTAGNAGMTTLNVRGAGLDDATQIRLQGGGLPTRQGTNLSVASPTEAWAQFDLAGVPVGTYDLAVAFAGGEEGLLPGAVDVISGTGGKLEADLIVPGLARSDRSYTLWIEYANVGDADVPAPLLAVSTTPSLPIKTADRSGWLSGTVQVLGLNPDMPAGILTPGTRHRIPVVIETATSEPEIHSALTIQEATSEPIDWENRRDALRPGNYSVDAWDALWPTLRDHLGDTWAEYLTVLGQSATRMQRRGIDVPEVRELLAMEIRKAAGRPVAALTGRVLDADGADPLHGVEVTARHQEGLAIHTGESDGAGHFVVTNLPDGVYELSVAGYIVTPTATVTLTQQADVNGLSVFATPIPPEPTLDPPPVLYTDPQVLDVAGTPHLVVSVNGQLYHTTHDGSGWASPTPVPGAQGYAARLVYAPDLLDGTDPGLALFWRAGTANDAAIHYAAARQEGLGDWAWSNAAVYADYVVSDTVDAGNTQPAAVVDADGTPVVVWQMTDFDNPEADPDLYYGHRPLTSTLLSWDQIAGVLVLDSPATLDDGTVLPIGTPVALMESGEAFVLDPADDSWKVEISRGFRLVKNGTMPKNIPYIGGRNGVKVTAVLKGEADESGASASGSLDGSLKMMRDRVTGKAGGSVEAKWVLDKQRCVFQLDEATLSLSADATGEFPIPQLTWQMFKIVRTEVYVQVGGNLTGKLVWKADSDNWPDGKVEGKLSLGFGGQLTLLGGYEYEVTGTGNVIATLDKKGLYVERDDVYFEITGLAKSGPISRTVKWRYPPSGQAQGNGDTRFADLSLLADGDMLVTTTVSLEPKAGTTTVYGTNAVVDVANDRVDDGPVALALADDTLTYAFWHRESDNPTVTLGNTLTLAVYDGIGWGVPVPLTGTLGFGREPAVAPDAEGDLLVAWVHADSSGWDLTSDPEAVLDARVEAEIRYALMQPGGTWSIPAALTANLGDYRHLALNAQPTGDVWATWVQVDTPTPTLYTARWNGTVWSAPQAVITAEIQGAAQVATLAEGVSLIWAQSADDPQFTFSEEGALYTAVYDGSAWSAPRPVSLTLPSPASGQAPASLAAAGGTGGLFDLSVTIPPEVCEPPEDDEPEDPPDSDEDPSDEDSTRIVRPTDPNEKVGPLGVDAPRWVDRTHPVDYTIYFENVYTATAPAQQVVVRDSLSPDLDWTSLVVTEIAFGDRVLPVTSGDGGAYLRVDVPDHRPGITRTWQVEIVVALDYTTGEVTAVLTTLDPETGELPLDPLAGFLPPNDETGRGEGRVSFRVTPEAAVPDGTEVPNAAEIVFDTETSIRTNTWRNTLGTPHALTVSVEGGGRVLREPDVAGLFPGQPITLTAVAGPGWTFAGWHGAAEGVSNPLVLTTQGAATVTATFQRRVFLPLVVKR